MLLHIGQYKLGVKPSDPQVSESCFSTPTAPSGEDDPTWKEYISKLSNSMNPFIAFSFDDEYGEIDLPDCRTALVNYAHVERSIQHPTVGVANEIVWIIVTQMVLQCYGYDNWSTKGVQCNDQASILPSMVGVRIACFDFLARHFLACQTLGRAIVEGCFVGSQPKPYTMPIAYSTLV